MFYENLGFPFSARRTGSPWKGIFRISRFSVGVPLDRCGLALGSLYMVTGNCLMVLGSEIREVNQRCDDVGVTAGFFSVALVEDGVSQAAYAQI